MPRPIILLDVDGVVADFEGAVRRTVAEIGYVMAVPTEWNFTLKFPAEVSDHYLNRASLPGWCSTIDPYPGAERFVAELRTLGDVVAVTAPLGCCPTWESERREWLRCRGIHDVVSTRRKDLVYGDVLIEDKVENLRTWWERWAVKPNRRRVSDMGILVQHTYNRHADWPTCVPVCDFDALLEAVRRAVG